MNPLQRAYGKLDVVGGFFSVYTEMRVKNRAVQGYVKLLICELDVYEPPEHRDVIHWLSWWLAQLLDAAFIRHRTRQNSTAYLAQMRRSRGEILAENHS